MRLFYSELNSEARVKVQVEMEMKNENGSLINRKWREFHMRNKTTYRGNSRSSIYGTTRKKKENDLKMILFSLAHLTPIKLPFCMSTGERERFFI